MPDAEISPVVPREGWHVMHLFYHVDHAQWSLYSDDEKRQAKADAEKARQMMRADIDGIEMKQEGEDRHRFKPARRKRDQSLGCWNMRDPMGYESE